MKRRLGGRLVERRVPCPREGRQQARSERQREGAPARSLLSLPGELFPFEVCMGKESVRILHADALVPHRFKGRADPSATSDTADSALTPCARQNQACERAHRAGPRVGSTLEEGARPPATRTVTLKIGSITRSETSRTSTTGSITRSETSRDIDNRVDHPIRDLLGHRQPGRSPDPDLLGHRQPGRSPDPRPPGTSTTGSITRSEASAPTWSGSRSSCGADAPRGSRPPFYRGSAARRFASIRR